MQQLIKQAQRAAEVSASILITGETGVGKEVLARAVHRVGPRANKNFIDQSCINIPPDLFESELFGFEEGSFTDAKKRKFGLIELADEGVLFLDEIGSMPLNFQSKLLRVLQERTFRRVGGTQNISVDIQLITASNRNLRKLVEAGEFREDLYYRLNVIELTVPPLRERVEDIPDLIGYFLRLNNSKMGLNVTEATPRAISALKAYRWPGNIRELGNIIERAMIFSEDGIIDLNLLPPEVSCLAQ
jgi:transcriptional regulator with PAS, ATPase and Fis domain